MAYFAPYIDSAGLHIPTYNDIRDDLIAQFKAIYGDDLYLGNDSQDYQMISAFALKNYDTMQLLQIVYNNHSPKTAVGTGLSSLVKLNGIHRKQASRSSCVLTITGKAGAKISHGICVDTQGIKWQLPEEVFLGQEEIEVTATCAEFGDIEAPPYTITKIENPQYGWISVTNKVPAVLGKPIETDEELRIRQTQSVSLPARNLLESTAAAIQAITGVTRSIVYDNDTGETDANGIPSHSIAAVVEGGDDQAIAEAIFLHKGPGGGTYGTTGIPVFRDMFTTRIHFFRPTYITVHIQIQIKPSVGYTLEIAQGVQHNVEHYLDTLSIGANVTVIATLKAITSAVNDSSKPPFSLTSLMLGTDIVQLAPVDVIIPYNAVSQRGTVTVVEVT